MQNKKVEAFLDVLKSNGKVSDNEYRELVVLSDRLTHITVALGMNGIERIATDVRTPAGVKPTVIIECAIKSQPVKEVIVNILKSYALIAAGDEVFEKESVYSGHILYLMKRSEDSVLMHMEIPFWNGCVNTLGIRTMMKFLDTVTG